MTRIELVTHIAAPCDRCFDLARSVDLHMHSTSTTGERAVAGRTSGLLDLNDDVTWHARHLGFQQTLTSQITTFERPRHSFPRALMSLLLRDIYLDKAAGEEILR